MDINVHIFTGSQDSHTEILKLVKQIHTGVGKILTNQEQQMASLSAIADEIAPLTSAVEANGVLLDRLADALEAAANDPAEVLALAAEIRTNRDNLVAQALANTPAEDEAPSA